MGSPSVAMKDIYAGRLLFASSFLTYSCLRNEIVRNRAGSAVAVRERDPALAVLLLPRPPGSRVALCLSEECSRPSDRCQGHIGREIRSMVIIFLTDAPKRGSKDLA